ncbi:MAG: signal peptidase II [Clostridia bacterium]
MKKSSAWLFLISLFIVAADQASKIFIRNSMEIGEKTTVIKDFFYITHHTNPGAAWGAFGEFTLALIILSALISVFLVYYFFKVPHVFGRLAICVVLGGALGNLIDRIAFMEVTDFFDFYFWGYDFPIFNIADMMITVGTVLLGIFILFIYKEEKKSHVEE